MQDVGRIDAVVWQSLSNIGQRDSTKDDSKWDTHSELKEKHKGLEEGAQMGKLGGKARREEGEKRAQ
jgi:hypothetical protein